VSVEFVLMRKKTAPYFDAVKALIRLGDEHGFVFNHERRGFLCEYNGM
jgi:hypothetical protein